MMPIINATLERGAVPGAQQFLATVSHQREFAFHDPDEFILVAVPVTLARPTAGLNDGQIHAEQGHTSMPCQALAGLQAAGQVERVWIVAGGLGRNRSEIDLLHRQCLRELRASGAVPRSTIPIPLIHSSGSSSLMHARCRARPPCRETQRTWSSVSKESRRIRMARTDLTGRWVAVRWWRRREPHRRTGSSCARHPCPALGARSPGYGPPTIVRALGQNSRPPFLRAGAHRSSDHPVTGPEVPTPHPAQAALRSPSPCVLRPRYVDRSDAVRPRPRGQRPPQDLRRFGTDTESGARSTVRGETRRRNSQP